MYDVVIVGAGPAGLTAGIYAGRSALKTIIIDEAQSGGTVNEAPLIENYPGYDEIAGMDLAEKITTQASKYCEIREFAYVEDITKNSDDTFNVTVDDEVLNTRFVILATGTKYKTLDVEHIDEYTGRGVSYCAVCDGGFFIGREVLVVGGGNSAATEALYLNRIGVNCSIVHRRDEIRCDRKLKSDIKEAGIKVYWDSEVKAINASSKLESVVIHNKKTGVDETVDVAALFVAIGHDANNQLAVDCNIKCDDNGYIIVDSDMQTSTDGIFAVGDVTGGIKQIIVAEAQGAVAISKIDSLI